MRRINAGNESGEDKGGAGAQASDGRRSLTLFGRRYPVPQSVLLRRTAGVVLVLGGIVGFLPFVGFWMLPLGVAVLSIDSARIRRLARRLKVRIGRRRKKG